MSEEYPLTRNYRSIARLNLQHFIWKRMQGFLLHPAIKVGSDNTKIADIGTGTGIWLLDLASCLPKAIQFHGFDISLLQCPTSQWLPSNVFISKLDIYDEVPEELVGKYDVIHIRFFMCVIKNANPEPVLDSLVKMLKPGGWIQWTELDPYSLKLETASLSTQANMEHNISLLNFAQNIMQKSSGEPPGWIAKLSHSFEKLGLQHIAEERLKMPEWDMANNHSNWMMGLEEISFHVPDGKSVREMIRRSAIEMEENERGIAIVTEGITVIGRKASF